MEDVTVCSVCLEEFDELSRIPKFLACHHTFCVICINAMSLPQQQIVCPLCRNKTTNSKLPTNNELLGFAKHKKETRTETIYLEVKQTVFQQRLLDIQDQIDAKKLEIAETEKNQHTMANGSKRKHQNHHINQPNPKHKLTQTSGQPLSSRKSVSSSGHFKVHERVKTTKTQRFRHSDNFKSSTEDSFGQEEPFRGKPQYNKRIITTKRGNSSPKFSHQSTATGAMDKINETIIAKDLIIESQNEQILKLRQDLQVANGKIYRLQKLLGKR